jgi:hypothetical protein
MIYGTQEFDDTLKKVIQGPQEDKKHGYRHSCYDECCDHAEVMSWHLYGCKPEELLTRSRPREDPDVTKYRLDNYEPTTKSAADKAITIVQKIFNPNLYSIRWSQESSGSKKLKEYSLEYYPEYNSVVNFTKDVLLRKMLADPNAVIAIMPQNVPGLVQKMGENMQPAIDESGEPIYVVQSSVEITPRIIVYGCTAIWNYDYDHFLINTGSESELDNQRNEVTWFLFDYYDGNHFIKFRAYVTPTNMLVKEIEAQYNHNFGEVPAWRLQGKSESEENGEIVFKSFFDSAVPYWNLCIIHESDLIGAYINHIHPIMYEITEECNFVYDNKYKCRAGLIKTEGGETISCPSCNGTGSRSMGPYGIKKISKDKLMEGDGPSQLPIGYVPVPTDATKMLEERVDRLRQLGLASINMDIEDKVGENQSGVAKVIDRSAQYDTLFNIGSVVFDVHLQQIFYFFNAYINGVIDRSSNKDPDKNLPEINKPTQFDIASTAELINNFKAAKDSNLDPNYLQIKQEEIATRDLTTNPDLKKFTFLLLDLDPLPGMSAQDVSLNVSRAFVRQIDAVIHNNLKRFIERAISEDKNFTEADKKDQVAKLEEYGKEYVTQNKPQIDPNMLPYGKPVQKGPQAQAA